MHKKHYGEANTINNQNFDKMKAEILSICISKTKGTKKKEVPSAWLINNWGIEGDAHANHWHRQVSILCENSINKMKQLGFNPSPGDFGENLLISNIDSSNVHCGDYIIIEDKIVLEVMQKGKECHSACEIQKITGKCIMPTEGIFAKVINGGLISKGNSVIIKCPHM
jgi:MOSC domain-containing protein YiiM